MNLAKEERESNSSICCFCLPQRLNQAMSDGDFLIPSSLLDLWIGNLLQGGTFPSPPFIDSVVSACTHGFPFYSRGYNMLQLLFLYSKCPYSCALLMSPSSLFSVSLISSTKGVSFVMYFSCPSPGESHFFKKARFLLMENGIKKARSAFRVLLLLESLNVSINVWMHTYIHIPV